MNQQQSSPISVQDLEDFVESTSSFAFEMRIREILSAKRRPVSHGGTYDDPRTGMPRQYDLRCEILVPAPPYCVRVALAVECKSLSEYGPLLVSRCPRPPKESGHWVLCHYRNDFSSTKWDGVAPIRVIGNESRYVSQDFVGKSVDHVCRASGGKVKGGDGEIYNKWSQSLSSASAMIGKLDSFPHAQQNTLFTVVLPILVVPDGRLFAVDFNNDGSRRGSINQVQETSFYVDYDPKAPGLAPFKFGHLEIMTESYLASFINGLAQDDPFPWINDIVPHDYCEAQFERWEQENPSLRPHG